MADEKPVKPEPAGKGALPGPKPAHDSAETPAKRPRLPWLGIPLILIAGAYGG